jgi:hypothetical protein
MEEVAESAGGGVKKGGSAGEDGLRDAWSRSAGRRGNGGVGRGRR